MYLSKIMTFCFSVVLLFCGSSFSMDQLNTQEVTTHSQSQSNLADQTYISDCNAQGSDSGLSQVQESQVQSGTHYIDWSSGNDSSNNNSSSTNTK